VPLGTNLAFVPRAGCQCNPGCTGIRTTPESSKGLPKVNSPCKAVVFEIQLRSKKRFKTDPPLSALWRGRWTRTRMRGPTHTCHAHVHSTANTTPHNPTHHHQHTHPHNCTHNHLHKTPHTQPPTRPHTTTHTHAHHTTHTQPHTHTHTHTHTTRMRGPTHEHTHPHTKPHPCAVVIGA